MADLVQEALDALATLPAYVIYLVMAVGGAVENVFPPVPADTFVLFGGFLSALGRADPWAVFVCTWLPNVASALIVYRLARRYGGAFFQTAVGHWLLHPRQLDQIAAFYARWGTAAIVVSRFLPGFRAMVPVFAGFSDMRFLAVAWPLATASALWYGLLVYVGAEAGRNWDAILGRLREINEVFLWIALVLLIGVLTWWWRTRRHRRE